MSSVKDETMPSNEGWKKAGGKTKRGKTKRGKATGRRETTEKYKAVGLHNLDCNNYKQYGIRARVAAYKCDRAPARIAHLLDKETRKGNKAALRCEVLTGEDDLCLEEAESEAREEARKSAQEEAEMVREEAEVTEDEAEVGDVEADEDTHGLACVP